MTLKQRAAATARGIVAQSPRRPRVPHLRAATSRSTRPRSVWMISPDWNRPSGGIRKLYRTVDVLNDAGIPAAIVHERGGFRCDWFEHSTRIASVRDTMVEPGDVIAVPEIYGSTIVELPNGIGQVVFNQNAYVTLESLRTSGGPAAAPYVANPDLLAVVAVSEENRDLLEYAFKGVAVSADPLGVRRLGLSPGLRPTGAADRIHVEAARR